VYLFQTETDSMECPPDGGFRHSRPASILEHLLQLVEIVVIIAVDCNSEKLKTISRSRFLNRVANVLEYQRSLVLWGGLSVLLLQAFPHQFPATLEELGKRIDTGCW